jgi:hypothetical protein
MAVAKLLGSTGIWNAVVVPMDSGGGPELGLYRSDTNQVTCALQETVDSEAIT